MRTFLYAISAGLFACTLGGCPAIQDLGLLPDPGDDGSGNGDGGGPQVAGVTMLRFDSDGPELGVVRYQATEFSLAGASWSGGVVEIQYRPELLASGSFAYAIPEGPAEVTFDEPVDEVRFFFVHGNGIKPGVATAFAVDGSELGTAASHSDTFHGDPDNYVAFAFDQPIARVEISRGIVDNFAY